MAGERRNGSILIGLIGGVAVGSLGLASLFGIDPIEKLGKDNLDGAACLIFAAVLIWWTFSPPGAGNRGQPPGKQRQYVIFFKDRNWGLGFETVTMVVGVVAAAIALFTLTHPPGHP
jgi:hypothetical protein